MSRPVVMAWLDWMRPGDDRTGLGVASIAAALRAARVDVHVVADAVNRDGFDVESYLDRLLAEVAAAGPGVLVGVSAFVWAEPEVQRITSALRARSDATIVLGGPQVSYLPKGELETVYPAAHVFVRGHGERAMVALATGPADGERGVHFAGTPDLGIRADVPLTELPSPYLDGSLRPGWAVRWETQRGCPFRCSFCQHRESQSRLEHTHFAPDRLRREAELFRDAGVCRVSVLDPIFHADSARALATLQMLRDVGLTARLSLQCRFELVNDAFLDALDGLDVELEFGLQTAHGPESRIIRRNNHMACVEGAVQKVVQRGIPFEVSLIYGLPTQTLDSFRASIDWCARRGVPSVRAWPLMLLRGTKLERDRERWGFVESTGERIPIVVASHSFTRDEHAEMARIAAELERAQTTRGAA